MKNRILSFTIAAGLVIGLSACNSSNNVVETSAGNITQKELYNTLKDRYGEQTLQELVFEKILADKYKVSDDEIKSTIDNLRGQYGDMIDTYDKDELNRLAKFQVLQEKAVIKDISASEEEMKEYYEAYEPEIKARHILVEDEKKAKELKKKLDEGAKFEDLAKENSKDPGSAENGGDLGWFGPGMMVPEFEEAAYNLKINEISNPVKSDNGWHIIQLLEKKEKKSFDEMKSEIEKEVKLGKIDQESVQKAMERELKDAKVKVKEKDLKDTFQAFQQ